MGSRVEDSKRGKNANLDGDEILIEQQPDQITSFSLV